MTRMTILAAALLTSACTGVYDPGGDVRERARTLATAEPGRLPDLCLSACTMGMIVHCVRPSTTLMFHGPQSKTPLTADAYQSWVNAIARFLPGELGHWYRNEGHIGTHWKSGAWAIEMGARPCEENDQ